MSDLDGQFQRAKILVGRNLLPSLFVVISGIEKWRPALGIYGTNPARRALRISNNLPKRRSTRQILSKTPALLHLLCHTISDTQPLDLSQGSRFQKALSKCMETLWSVSLNMLQCFVITSVICWTCRVLLCSPVPPKYIDRPLHFTFCAKAVDVMVCTSCNVTLCETSPRVHSTRSANT